MQARRLDTIQIGRAVATWEGWGKGESQAGDEERLREAAALSCVLLKLHDGRAATIES